MVHFASRCPRLPPNSSHWGQAARTKARSLLLPEPHLPCPGMIQKLCAELHVWGHRCASRAWPGKAQTKPWHTTWRCCSISAWTAFYPKWGKTLREECWLLRVVHHLLKRKKSCEGRLLHAHLLLGNSLLQKGSGWEKKIAGWMCWIRKFQNMKPGELFGGVGSWICKFTEAGHRSSSSIGDPKCLVWVSLSMETGKDLFLKKKKKISFNVDNQVYQHSQSSFKNEISKSCSFSITQADRPIFDVTLLID